MWHYKLQYLCFLFTIVIVNSSPFAEESKYLSDFQDEWFIDSSEKKNLLDNSFDDAANNVNFIEGTQEIVDNQSIVDDSQKNAKDISSPDQYGSSCASSSQAEDIYRRGNKVCQPNMRFTGGTQGSLIPQKPRKGVILNVDELYEVKPSLIEDMECVNFPGRDLYLTCGGPEVAFDENAPFDSIYVENCIRGKYFVSIAQPIKR